MSEDRGLSSQWPRPVLRIEGRGAAARYMHEWYALGRQFQIQPATVGFEERRRRVSGQTLSSASSVYCFVTPWSGSP